MSLLKMIIAFILLLKFLPNYKRNKFKRSNNQSTWVLYMSSSFCLLGVESSDFSQAEKERTACKAEQIHKMTTIFTQNGPRLSF